MVSKLHLDLTALVEKPDRCLQHEQDRCGLRERLFQWNEKNGRLIVWAGRRLEVDMCVWKRLATVRSMTLDKYDRLKICR